MLNGDIIKYVYQKFKKMYQIVLVITYVKQTATGIAVFSTHFSWALL